MNRVKTAVLVSGGGTNLQALINEQQAGRLPHVEFVSVIASRPDAYALTRAQKAGIPGHVVRHRGERVDEEQSARLLRHEPMPDPMREAIEDLRSRVTELERQHASDGAVGGLDG